jgi:hypothetical protein
VTHRIDPRRYPAVYLLRARREREEAEIRAPVEAALDATARRLRAARNALAALERILGAKIAERVVERIAHRFASAVQRHIRRAVNRAIARMPRPARPGDPPIITLKLLRRELVWLDPESLHRRVLEEWRCRTSRNLRTFCDLERPIAQEEQVVVLRVDVPSLGDAEHIMPERIGIRRFYQQDRSAA